MLVISRRRDEILWLENDAGDRIKVQIVEILNGDKVRVGIDAPLSWGIVRDEIAHKYNGERERARRIQRGR